MTEITETNKFSPLSAEILTMFYLGETCGSQICVREYPMTGSQMTVFTSYNQIHCWVDQNKMKNAISFSISVLSLIVFAIAFFLPTTGENKCSRCHIWQWPH
jgi:L-cysteine desulfidase